MKKLCIILFTLTLCQACTKDISSKEFYKVEHVEQKAENAYRTNIELKKITVDSTIEWSHSGTFWIRDNVLCFSDYFFGYIYQFDTTGRILDQQVGFGKGPNEVPAYMYAVPLPSGHALVAPSNSFIYLFTASGQKINETSIDWKVSASEAPEIIASPNPQNHLSYEFDFGINNIVRPWSEHEVAIGLTASLTKFNGYFNSDLYYNYSRILGIVDCQTGKITRLAGRRSPFYLEKKNIPNFDHFCFEVTPNNYFVSFYADPKIYVIDKHSDQALYAFGSSGRDMQTDYPLTDTYEAAEMQMDKQYSDYGYYHYLTYDPVNKMTFRGYKKGGNQNTEGLQIYKNTLLIADINVPKGFKVIGSINHSFYASINADESEGPSEEHLSFYRFVLKNE